MYLRVTPPTPSHTHNPNMSSLCAGIFHTNLHLSKTVSKIVTAQY